MMQCYRFVISHLGEMLMSPPNSLALQDVRERDPVRIAVLAMTLGRASFRAAFTGTEVRVTAPDEETAAIFRAALAETARTRGTDRLIRVVLE